MRGEQLKVVQVSRKLKFQLWRTCNRLLRMSRPKLTKVILWLD